MRNHLHGKYRSAEGSDQADDGIRGHEPARQAKDGGALEASATQRRHRFDDVGLAEARPAGAQPDIGIDELREHLVGGERARRAPMTDGVDQFGAGGQADLVRLVPPRLGQSLGRERAILRRTGVERRAFVGA